MHKYEVLYILAGALENQKKDALIEKYSQLVVKEGGIVDSINKWGMKKLAYPINYKNEGFYVLMTYQAKTDFNAELERHFRIAKDEVIRFMVSRAVLDGNNNVMPDEKESKSPKAKKEKVKKEKAEEIAVADESKAEEIVEAVDTALIVEEPNAKEIAEAAEETAVVEASQEEQRTEN